METLLKLDASFNQFAAFHVDYATACVRVRVCAPHA